MEMWKHFTAISVSITHCLIAIAIAGELKTFSQDYGPDFDQKHYKIFEIIPPATISQGALQMTPDSGSKTFNSGRILLKQRFKLCEDEDHHASNIGVASFNTSFLINVYRPENGSAAEGMAFIIAPDLLVPPNSFGHFLGLTNSMTDGNDSNRLVAVELDTFKQYFDPDDNHVGIDVNSITSIKTEYLTPHNITISPIGVKFHYVWVDYDGLNKAIHVYIKEQAGRDDLTPSKPGSPLLSAGLNLPGTPREFKFKDLRKATNGFDEKKKLGQGGFGVVYKGLLAKENMEIAIKWFSRESIKGENDFLAELTVINRLRHKHLVKLLGWCHKNGKLLLVYEYMPNKSLDQHLFVGPNKEPLAWDLRHKIISGVASALHYLHNEYDHKVVHRDLKASNIMLDSDFNARLGDFGLARVLDHGKTSYAESEGVMGTMGYIAPECLTTRQSDVYAFGAVLLEVVCGQRPGIRIPGFQFLVDWVWMLHKSRRLLEAVDERLRGNYVKEEAERLLLLGLACSHPNAIERPKTTDIVQIISGAMPLPVVPLLKPTLVWPSGV